MDYFLAFVPIFMAVDALGMIPVFMGLTHGMAPADKTKLIRDSTFTALLVSIAFVVVGKLVFRWLGITISDFLVAGGAILFILSIRDLLVFGEDARVPRARAGVVPLAVPLIVGPAVLTTSLILVDSFGVYPTLFSIVTNILLCGLALRSSGLLLHVLGETGSHTVSKISNLLLAAIGVMLMRRGLLEIFSEWISKLPK